MSNSTQTTGLLEKIKTALLKPISDEARPAELPLTKPSGPYSDQDVAQSLDAVIEAWAHALEARNNKSESHIRRVTKMTLDLARALGVGEEELVHVRRGAILHDIGEISIPDAILMKTTPLLPSERAYMRKHPVYAYEMLRSIVYLRPALDIPYCHHERWDGTGYPRGLKGDAIPLAARIFAVVDTWDALRTDRPHREAWPEPEVWSYLETQAGTEFDPDVVKAFIRITRH